MYLVVGLGNPGTQYSRTRHNVGWFVIDALARRHGIDLSRKSCEARVGTGIISEQRVLLAKPQTFMNLSGRAVAPLLRYHNVEAGQLLIICDDLNLPLGKLRVRSKGSDGGHNGLKSVAQMIATTDYARLRFGVGEPERTERAERGTAGYVLRPFMPDEWTIVDDMVTRAADCVETFVRDGVMAAMNQFN
ncbi:MAG TPA: aminoacyl-tRNA hydrolase [Abditibacteriaceae bacterium]|nr:aminoacyl-tRNA hydrolase [Abditibacteriaceae bacterium]